MLWKIVWVFALWMMVAFVLAVILGKWLKWRRELAEQAWPERELLDAVFAIEKFLAEIPDDEEEEDDDKPLPGVIRKLPEDRSLCVVCSYEDSKASIDEDISGELIVIRRRQVPLCYRHKETARECLRRQLIVDYSPSDD